MNKQDIAQVIEALSPYTRINTESLLTSIALNPIGELPGELDTTVQKALLAVVWRDIEGDSAGILAEWDKQTIVEITHKISGSGNPTWYCKLESGKTLYIRQSNKEIMTAHYPDIEQMSVGDVVKQVSITVYTSIEGQFLVPQKVIEGGIFAYIGETHTQRQQRVIRDYLQPLDNPIFFDVETTGVDESAEIISIGIVQNGKAEQRFIQPTDIHKLTVKGKSGKSASDVNGITEADLKDAPQFSEVYADIKRLSGQTVITYGDFDIRLIRQDCERHNLVLPAFTHVDLMAIYGEYEGTIAGRGGYKKHKLVDAYESVMGKKLENAHTASADALAMYEMVEKLLGSCE